MSQVELLDCTLRDGGYINEWKFGLDVIKDIILKLVRANVDIIECGYLNDRKKLNSDYSIFEDVIHAWSVTKEECGNSRYALMINFGEYNPSKLPINKGSKKIIRLAFHKKDMEEALKVCQDISEKGYSVFVQPMGTMEYQDDEFIHLIYEVNKLDVEAFYIVDSFGVIETKDFKRLVFIADNNLKKETALGYHSHNNMQQAYDNAKFFAQQNLDRKIIVDSSVFGMGRGAGNLNTEIFAKYLNEYYNHNYSIEPVLEIIDEYLKPIYNKTFWGYSLPFYLSAIHNCHPNYASYYAEKNMLSVKSLNEVLKSIPEMDKKEFSIQKAEAFYQAYQKNYIDDRMVLRRLEYELGIRDILIVAPGASINQYQQHILEFVKNKKPIIISVNVSIPFLKSDYVMCVNEKRLKRLELNKGEKLILTSNLHLNRKECYRINYASFLCGEHLIADNVTLMLIRLLISIGIRSIYLAGFDGYRAESEMNYYDSRLALGTTISNKIKKNELIGKELEALKEKIEINFLTPTLYVGESEETGERQVIQCIK